MPRLPDTTGIYEILCVPTQKRYIGSTQRSFRKRWAQHRSELRRGIHPCLALQRAWNKYGEAVFEFTVLQRGVSSERLVEREQFYIDQARNLWGKHHVFNTCDWAGTRKGVPQSDAVRKAISEGNKARWQDPAYRAKMSAMRTGQKRSDATRQAISQRVKARMSTPEARANLSRKMKGRRPAATTLEKATAAKARTWYFIDPDGNEREIVNLHQFCKENGLHYRAMQSVHSGKGPYYKHHGWRRSERALGL
jgi:group I intron endonuclease